MKTRKNKSKDSKSAKSDIPSRPWYKNTMAIFGLVSAIVATASGLIVVFQKFEPHKVIQNTVIVFDRSTAMNDPFEGGTKLDAAIQAVNKALGSEVAGADNLALRSFGGPCNGTNSRIDIGFRQHNEDRLRDALQTLQAGGQTTLTSAIIEAIGDFNDPKRFEGMNKRIIVITGGDDDCEPDSATFIRNRLAALGAGKDINVSFRFIGMALKPEQHNQLNAIAKETGGLSEENVDDQVFFVNSQRELEDVLNRIVEVEPILSAVNNMADIMNRVTDQLNPAVSAINNKDYAVAQENLKAARDEFNNSELWLKDLEQRLNVELFHEQLQELYKLTTDNHELQQKQLGLLQTMIDQGKRGDTDALRKTIDEWNGIISIFDSNITTIDGIIRDIESKLREANSP